VVVFDVGKEDMLLKVTLHRPHVIYEGQLSLLRVGPVAQRRDYALVIRDPQSELRVMSPGSRIQNLACINDFIILPD
jgi:hypothetical protein